MTGVTDLETLLAHPQPRLLEGEYVFCTMPEGSGSQVSSLKPLATFKEEEGMSMLVEKSQAEDAGLNYSSVLRGITLSVHSSLEAVGLTAAVAGRLAAQGIPANVIAAHYHDHVFVPADKAEQALQLLNELSG